MSRRAQRPRSKPRQHAGSGDPGGAEHAPCRGGRKQKATPNRVAFFFIGSHEPRQRTVSSTRHPANRAPKKPPQCGCRGAVARTALASAGRRPGRILGTRPGRVRPARSGCQTATLIYCPRKKPGRGERIRTSGLYVPNVALYQAKLHPELLISCKTANWYPDRSVGPARSGNPGPGCAAAISH